MKQRLSVNILAKKYNGDSRMCVHWYFAKHFLELSYHFLSKSNACIFNELRVSFKERCVEFFFFIIFFIYCSLVRKESIKRPGFYMLQVKRVFPNFPQLKQLNKIKNTCEYCDLLELSLLWLCFFQFLMTMFLSTVIS